MRVVLVQLLQRAAGDDATGLSLEEAEHVVGEALVQLVFVVAVKMCEVKANPVLRVCV